MPTFNFPVKAVWEFSKGSEIGNRYKLDHGNHADYTESVEEKAAQESDLELYDRGLQLLLLVTANDQRLTYPVRDNFSVSRLHSRCILPVDFFLSPF